MRIVHVYNQLDPSNGGPPHVIVGLAAGQQSLGHEVVLVSEDPAESPALDTFLSDHLEPVPVRHVVKPFGFMNRFSRRAFEAALDGADIVHLHGIWPVAPMMASRICREMGIPWVIAPHGSLHEGALGEKRLKKLLGMWLLGYRRYIADASALHALNRHEAEATDYPWYVGVSAPDKVVVIPNGVFPDDFERKPNPAEFRAAFPELSDDPFILFLSRLHPGKGCDLLGAAFGIVAQEIPDIRLVLIGQDQGGLTDCLSAARSFGVHDRVHWLGPMYDSRKHAAYCAASAYCLPSRHEGFSMAITEALAWSCPVVATQSCHFPELTEFDCGMEVTLDPKSIADGLLDVLRDPEAARAMGERGRSLVMSTYTWPKIAARTIAVYNDILGQS